MALRQGVDGFAKGGMPLKQVDVPPLGIQNIGRHPGEDVEVGYQLEELLGIKQYVHGGKAPL